jgi:hypothetical protein
MSVGTYMLIVLINWGGGGTELGPQKKFLGATLIRMLIKKYKIASFWGSYQRKILAKKKKNN